MPPSAVTHTEEFSFSPVDDTVGVAEGQSTLVLLSDDPPSSMPVSSASLTYHSHISNLKPRPPCLDCSTSPMRPFGGKPAPVISSRTTFDGLPLHIASSVACSTLR